ncbi:MAG: hypothetical protein ABI792_08935, partial [bacterium]
MKLNQDNSNTKYFYNPHRSGNSSQNSNKFTLSGQNFSRLGLLKRNQMFHRRVAEQLPVVVRGV